MNSLQRIGAVVLAPAVAAVALATPAIAGSASQPITGKSVGPVKLGASFGALKKAGLVGPLANGCELDPGTHSAKLTSLSGGQIQLSASNKVSDISVSAAGANANGVSIGSPLSAIKSAYTKVTIDKNTEEVFSVDVATVHPAGGGQISFAVNDKTHKVTFIGVPYIPFCD